MIEFTINSKPNLTFRTKDINGLELLALRSCIDFDNLNKTVKLYGYILEHVEVKAGDVWMTVKDGETYLPIGIDKELDSLEELINFFMKEFILKTFQKSNESTMKQVDSLEEQNETPITMGN